MKLGQTRHPCVPTLSLPPDVIPAKAGIQEN